MEGKDGGGEENNNDNVQFYFDSAAGRWWYFDEEQQSWLPWEEESEEGKESVTPKKTSTSPDKAGLNSKREQGEEVEDHAQSLQQREERNTPRQLQEALDPSSQQESEGELEREGDNVRDSCSREERNMNASTDRLRTMLDSISSRQSLDEAILGLSGESVFRTTSSGSSFHDLLVGSFGGGDGGAGRGGADGGHSPLRSFSESRVSRPHSFLHGLGSGKLEGNHPLLPKRSSTASDGGEDEEDSQQRDANGGHEDDEDEDEQEEELPEPEKMSFVRRSTRMLTFKDKGGLAGCLKEAAANRKSLIEESGGLIPGTEEHRQEEWKRRARELASQSHARAQRRWLDAARRASSSSQNDEDKKILHFTDLVERIRKQSQGAADLNGRGFSVGPGGAGAAIDQLASSPGALTVLAPPPPGVLDHRIDPLAAAANLLHKPEVDLKEQRRRSSGFAGGQQGYVRFADATLRDPNYHLQFQDLLTQQGGKRRPSGSGEPESPGSDEGGGEGSSFATPSGEEDYPASRSAESVQRT